jgi:hypothetical protein
VVLFVFTQHIAPSPLAAPPPLAASPAMAAPAAPEILLLSSQACLLLLARSLLRSLAGRFLPRFFEALVAAVAPLAAFDAAAPAGTLHEKLSSSSLLSS